MSDGLFELAPHPIVVGDVVDVGMPWGATWRCVVKAVRHEQGWPVAELTSYAAVEPFLVDVARCRLVGRQPALDGL